ncbi:diguanylate cyclase [Microvirga sp. SRT01]|uniref:diguanylate cyclase n=1 Tax=Sphingomonas longa TaxID=2778730 RepID=A0ABS2D6T8_9SPHN|nr:MULTISPECIES: diguanylate cyclase [Alphaproteobacteria]MBM6575789.1 diguanylate cyclase [Sphingomonas sp. BT552]MBR7708836.1 diguanylate cyclase [Microvirga sp. SRT01]
MIERVVRQWWMALVMLLVAWVPSPAAASMGTPLDVCVVRAAPGMTAAALFAGPERFDCTSPQRAFGGGDFWVLSQPLPKVASHGPLTIRTGSVWQNRVMLHILFADGTIRQAGYTSRTTGERLMLGAMIAQTLPHHDAAAVRLLWHVEGAANIRGIVRQPMLATHGENADSEVSLAALYGAFGGMVLALVVYNLALWRALRQAFQPAYCLLLLCLLLYALSSSGALGQWYPGLDNNDRIRISGLALAGSATSVMFFARLFFEPRVFAGWLGPATTAGMIATMASATAFAVLAPWQIHVLDVFMMGSIAVLIVLVPIILFSAWRQRSNFLWMFAIAWGVPIAAAGMRITGAYGWTADNFWVDNSTLMAMAVEAIMSSIGIAYRIHLLAKERDEARVQEIAARLLADSDPLTGLLNRRSFLSQAIGREGPQTLLIADLDHFKAVNETIGHDGGDEVLRAFAKALRTVVPNSALVARIGGEEFAVIVDASIGLAASRVLDSLRGIRMPYDMAVTASIGTCTGPLAKETDWKALYRCADRALYEAKAAGRDRARDAGALSAAA